MWKYIKKYIVFLVLAALCMIVEVMVDLFQPRIMSQIVDDGVLGINNGGVGDLNLVITLGLRMLLLIFFGFLGGALCSIFANIGVENAANGMRKDGFARIMSFSFPQVDRFGTGALITRITNDIVQVRNMIEMFVRGLIRTSFFFVGSIFFMFSLYPKFGLIALCALPVIALIMILSLRKVSPDFTKMQEELDVVNDILQEDIAGIRIIKACVREIYEKLRFGKANDQLTGTQLKVLIVFAFMSPAVNLIMYIVVILIILMGSVNGSGMAAAPGAIMGAITYTTQLMNSIMSLVMMFQNISRGSASWKRVKQILHTEPELKDGTYIGEKVPGGMVEFRDVSFSYPDTAKPVLEHINLTINPGETLAIMGATGSGKSTLVNLIPRFYDVSSGSVLVDGTDVRDYTQHALREKIAMTLQKAELFSLTVEENIKWGDLNASQEEVVNAAQTAQADGFISAMSDGYDSMVAERGMSLSGGQRQRVSIARTILKEAEVFIFDDSTSALDLRTEAMFYDALSKSHPDATKVIVAQRIASVRRADRIAILENGTILACDSHENLLKTCSIYQDIYQSQMGGDENE